MYLFPFFQISSSCTYLWLQPKHKNFVTEAITAQTLFGFIRFSIVKVMAMDSPFENEAICHCGKQGE